MADVSKTHVSSFLGDAFQHGLVVTRRSQQFWCTTTNNKSNSTHFLNFNYNWINTEYFPYNWCKYVPTFYQWRFYMSVLGMWTTLLHDVFIYMRGKRSRKQLTEKFNSDWIDFRSSSFWVASTYIPLTTELQKKQKMPLLLGTYRKKKYFKIHALICSLCMRHFGSYV